MGTRREGAGDSSRLNSVVPGSIPRSCAGAHGDPVQKGPCSTALVGSVLRGPMLVFWALHLLGMTLPPGHGVRKRGGRYQEPRRKSRFNQGSERAGQART